VNQVKAEAKKLIDLRNTAGKASNMASFIVALLHSTMYFIFVKEFGVEIGKPKFLDWKHTYHTEVGKLSPSCKPNGSKEKEDWRGVTPSCQPEGSKEKKEDWRGVTPSSQPEGSKEKKAWLKTTIEANPACKPDGSQEKKDWRKAVLEGHQKRLTKRMAVAAQQAEAMRMAPTKSVATVIEENKSAQADLKC